MALLMLLRVLTKNFKYLSTIQMYLGIVLKCTITKVLLVLCLSTQKYLSTIFKHKVLKYCPGLFISLPFVNLNGEYSR